MDNYEKRLISELNTTKQKFSIAKTICDYCYKECDNNCLYYTKKYIDKCGKEYHEAEMKLEKYKYSHSITFP